MSLPATAAASVAFIYLSLITHRKERNRGRDKAITVSKAVFLQTPPQVFENDQ